MSSLSPLDTAPECTSLLHPSIVNLSFSFTILLGILVSYLPQHHRIISRGTSEGISPLFLLLGFTSGTCGFLNILILSWGVLGCCGKGIGGFNCFAASMGVAQVGTQWTCFAIILALFLIYFPRTPDNLRRLIPATGPSSRTATAVAIICVVHLFVMGATTSYLSLLHHAPHPVSPGVPPPPSDALIKWANFLGVQSAVLASIQYIPQLWTTWNLKHVGSLSIPMMCIQTPGSFVWVVSLASREGTDWSSWMTYLVTGTLQGALLVMCIVWEVKEKKALKKGVESVVGGERREEREIASERTALLGETSQ